MAKLNLSALEAGVFTTRPQAWLAYQLWLGALLAKHDDAGLEASVKITKAPDGTWILNAEVKPCSEG